MKHSFCEDWEFTRHWTEAFGKGLPVPKQQAVRLPHTCRRAVCLRGEIPHDDAGGWRPVGRLIGGGEPAHDVGIGARSADVFTDLVNDEHVQPVQKDLGHILPCALQKLRLLRRHLIRGDAVDLGGSVVGVLQNGDAENDRQLSENHAVHDL